jgi:hypothetical protein
MKKALLSLLALGLVVGAFASCSKKEKKEKIEKMSK